MKRVQLLLAALTVGLATFGSALLSLRFNVDIRVALGSPDSLPLARFQGPASEWPFLLGAILVAISASIMPFVLYRRVQRISWGSLAALFLATWVLLVFGFNFKSQNSPPEPGGEQVYAYHGGVYGSSGAWEWNLGWLLFVGAMLGVMMWSFLRAAAAARGDAEGRSTLSDSPPTG